MSRYKKVQGPVVDPDLPVCITWNEEEVGDWVASNGWPDLKVLCYLIGHTKKNIELCSIDFV